MFTHQLCHPVPPPSLAWFDLATDRIPPTVPYSTVLMMVSAVTVGIPAEFQPATPEPWTTTVIIGANDSVVTGHAPEPTASHAAADGTLAEMTDLLHDR